MQFSRKIDYACILLASLRKTHTSGLFVSLAVIAREQHLPLPFLEKLAGTLRRRGVLDARKGADGGYRLKRNPKTLTIKEIIDIFEEPPVMRCLKSSDPEQFCSLAPFCPTRSRWREIEEKVDRVFAHVTVDSL